MGFKNSDFFLYIDLSPQSGFVFPITQKIIKTSINEPSFLQFLKKKLNNSTLIDIEQNGSERVAYFLFEDIRGLIKNRFRLIIETMGRYSNLILTDSDNNILQAYKYVEPSIMPHKKYKKVKSDMPDLMTEDIETLKLKFKYKENILGLGGILRKNIKTEEEFLLLINTIRQSFQSDKFKLYLYNNKDIYPFNLHIDLKKEEVDDDFIVTKFITKPNKNEFKNRKNNLETILNKRIKSLEKRLGKVKKELQNCDNADKYKNYAENLLSNPNLDTKYKKSIKLNDIYTLQEINIPLNPEKNLFSNAQNYFKKYKKAKKSKSIIKKRIKETMREFEFIHQLLFDVYFAQNEKDVEDIKNIMVKENLIRMKKQKNRKLSYKPYEHIKIDDFDAYVGKNARGNDFIRIKLASKNDLWFHAKDKPGAHLILKLPNKLQSVDDNVKILCAEEIARRSKLSNDEKIDVDYTFVKFVKKPKNFKTGMVTYSNFKTITVKK